MFITFLIKDVQYEHIYSGTVDKLNSIIFCDVCIDIPTLEYIYSTAYNSMKAITTSFPKKEILHTHYSPDEYKANVSLNTLCKYPVVKNNTLTFNVTPISEDGNVYYKGKLDTSVTIHYRIINDKIQIQKFFISDMKVSKDTNLKYTGDEVFPDWLTSDSISEDNVLSFMKTF